MEKKTKELLKEVERLREQTEKERKRFDSLSRKAAELEQEVLAALLSSENRKAIRPSKKKN